MWSLCYRWKNILPQCIKDIGFGDSEFNYQSHAKDCRSLVTRTKIIEKYLPRYIDKKLIYLTNELELKKIKYKKKSVPKEIKSENIKK